MVATTVCIFTYILLQILVENVIELKFAIKEHNVSIPILYYSVSRVYSMSLEQQSSK